jgi:hypothetical protein
MAATNRFSVSPNDLYTQQYVPKPFEAMYKVGMNMQKEHETQQAESDALSDALNKIKVANEVISEGSGDDLGIKSRSTGYGDFKNQVINKYALANKQLADEYATTGDATKFKQGISKLKSDFSGDYQKLKIAEANSVAIEEADKKYREAKHAGANPHVLNALAEEGARLRENPYAVQYKGAPISELVDTPKKVNEYANNYADQIMKTYQPVKDAHGYLTYKDTHGVGRARIIEGAGHNYDLDNELTSDAREQAIRALRDHGVDLNSDQGKEMYNSLLQQHKEKFITSVVDKAEKSVQNLDRKKDIIGAEERLAKKEEDAKKIYTTNEQGNAEVLGIEGALNSLDLGDVLNSNGDFKTKSNTVVENTSVTGPGMINAPIFGGIVKALSPSLTADEIVNKGYAKILAKHKELGLPQPVDANGKPTGKIKEQLYNYALNLAQTRSTTSRLQPSTIEGMNKRYLGKNSDISNMEFYEQGDKGSNAKTTNEVVNKLAKNSSFTGIDYFNENGAGWKVVYTEDGNVDKALIAVPRDQTFKADTKPVQIISVGAMNFAKTGKIDNKYKDSQFDYLQREVSNILPNVNLVASSTEQNSKGDIILRGSFVDNSTGVPLLKGVTHNTTTGQIKFSSLGEIQADKTSEVQVKGSLTQYNSSLGEKTKNSEVEIED